MRHTQRGFVGAVNLSGQGWRDSVMLLSVFIGFLILSGSAVLAQTLGATAEDVRACKTNLGSQGHWMSGLPGMVYAPVAYDDVKVAGTDLEVAPQVRNGLGVFVGPAFNAKEPAMAPTALVEFLRGNEGVVYRCTVSIVAYEPDLQDIETLKVGDCNLKLVAGLPQLMVGHAQVWEVPQDAEDFVFGPYKVMDASTLAARMFMPLGFSPGVSMVLWTTRNQDGGFHANLCPFRVFPVPKAGGLQSMGEKDLCQDSSGIPMRLSVGQEVTLQIPEGDERAFAMDEYALADPTIVESQGWNKVTKTPILKAISPGTTSVVLLSNAGGVQARVCEIQVN